jgi:hypothetical protein
MGGGGNTATKSRWFAYDPETRTFSYIRPTTDDEPALATAVKGRVDWRLETYLSRPGPGRNNYKVIPNENTACIVLGTSAGDGLPRSGGWKVIKINGAFKYARFARIAINWIAAESRTSNPIGFQCAGVLPQMVAGRELSPRHADFQAFCSGLGIYKSTTYSACQPLRRHTTRHNPGTPNLSCSHSWHTG